MSTHLPTAKTYATWEAMRIWCREHPNEPAMIATPTGTFVITFKPSGAEPATPPAGSTGRGR